MAQFTVNATRFDPYKNFKFRVKWDGRYVAGVSKVSALKRTTEVVKHRDGGDPSTSRKSPGRTEYDAITLERGVTHDVDVRAVGEQGLELRNARRSAARRCRWRTSARTSSSRCYNEAGQKVALVQGLPLLGVGVPGAARPGRERQRGRDPAHQAGERGLGARRQCLLSRRSRPSRTRPDHEATVRVGMLLDAWERGMHQPPPERVRTLLRLAVPDGSDVSALSAGQVDGYLLDLRQRGFGSEVVGVVECPECAAQAELNFDIETT